MKITDPITDLPYVGEAYAQKLKRLDIYTIEDLLHHIPHRFLDYTNVLPIRALKIGEEAAIVGEILSLNSFRSKTGKFMQTAKITDGRDTLDIIWVNQPFILRMLKEGDTVQFFGKLNFWGKKRAFIFPKFEKIGSSNTPKGKLVPIYSETEGVNSKWISKRAKDALKKVKIDDFFSKTNLERLNLINLEKAFIQIHDTKDKDNYDRAVQRLAFNELLLLQLNNAFERIEWQSQNKSLNLETDEKLIKTFQEKLPFDLTNAQKRAINDISKDLGKKYPMNRLLQGDVGAGKTVVAAFAVVASHLNGYQSALLAPTQVLAQQHYDTLSRLLKEFNINISLYTGSTQRSDENTDNLIIGTHALLHRPHLFEKTAVVIIDEQHRFGVRQRARMLDNTKSDDHTPHILSMTATPIPRTITLTMYGDLDISLLDEMPKGRKPVKTWVVPKKKRDSAYNWIEREIEEKNIQVFVVCPFIDESENEHLSQVKAATVEFEKIKKIMPNKKIALLHGKLKPDEKDGILNKFKDQKYDILVTTPVVEVGIDIPNATVMMIEASDRFGLAQLHQLRGRVGRSDLQSYCLLFTDSKTKKSIDRLKLMEEHNNGQKLAELDLKLRGPGEIFGVRQSGLPELKIAAWDDIALIKKSKKFAEHVVKNQKDYPDLLKYYERKQISNN